MINPQAHVKAVYVSTGNACRNRITQVAQTIVSAMRTTEPLDETTLIVQDKEVDLEYYLAKEARTTSLETYFGGAPTIVPSELSIIMRRSPEDVGLTDANKEEFAARYAAFAEPLGYEPYRNAILRSFEAVEKTPLEIYTELKPKPLNFILKDSHTEVLAASLDRLANASKSPELAAELQQDANKIFGIVYKIKKTQSISARLDSLFGVITKDERLKRAETLGFQYKKVATEAYTHVKLYGKHERDLK